MTRITRTSPVAANESGWPAAGASGLVADSTGDYDAATYERQVAHGIDG
jgi:hypothetical protein